VADLRFGAAALRVTASPVVAASGEHLGAIVEWLDRTDEVEAEVELGQTIDAAAAGHLDQRVALEGKRGFFAVAARQMNALLDTNLRVFTDLQRVLGALAAGRLGERITADYRGMYAQIKADANATGEQLTATMAEIRSAAIQVRNDARELSRGTENLSARTEQQASSLQETASAMEEMTSTIKQNADNAVLANRLATQAAEVAERGTSVVTDAVAAMGEINASSRRIADIIGVVDEIALQTNLLALNAAVEAARAGEQGRGFAVVASEVRSLASRSAVAAKEIKALIQDSLDKVDGGSKLVDDSGQTLGEISTGMAKVRDLVAAISMASSEQARGVDEINRAVMQIDDTTQQNAALVEQTSAANQALTDQADRLSDLVSSFDLGDAPTLQVVPSRGPRVAGVA
jgi:methyl-accepting chemotaxis protein